ncbi:hypothetical protein HJB80_11660 [Rhizobium lentis]|uniref:hypothetical protein n=1 Tax=Rhizobium lentis TaxID=1138194 RepID=UPI001C82E5F7|nr:hypothetical protein [Rhizobium lentis]MBX5133309.1 hypothetical protein [Rhizobium lentis]
MTFDDIVTFLLEEKVTPTHQQLVQWIDRYPQFAEELSDYFAEWAVREEMGDDDEVAEPRSERFANIGVSHALNLLHVRKPKAALVHAAESKATTLAQLCKGAGLSLTSLADRVRLDEEILMKLDLSRIVAGSIPRRVANMLAMTLGASTAEIWHILSASPRPTSKGALQKSRQRAQVRTESFEDAIRSSSLPSELRNEWLRSIDEGTGPP